MRTEGGAVPSEAEIRVLLVEDNQDDAELLQMRLAQDGLKAKFRRVDRLPDYQSALDHWESDIIISDFRLPGFSGLDALRLYRESGLQVPFLLVSGTIGEEAAVECLKSGAHDYIMKDKLIRLAPAIRRSLQDFAERAEHRAMERRYRQIVEQSSEGVWILDEAGRIIMANLRLSQILDCPSQLLHDYPLLDLLTPEDKAQLLSFPRESIVVPVRRPRGEAQAPLWGSLTATPIFDEVTGRNAVLGRISDVTQAKQMESQLLQAQKMEALGRLAGGVAHDFNNLLSVIIGFTEMLITDLAPDGPSLESFYEVLRAARQGAALTRQLLIVGRRQAALPQGVGIHDALEELRQILSRLLGPDVELCFALEASPDSIVLDRTAFSQIVLNLVINARDAMPQGGRIQVQTNNDDSGRVVLRVVDQGVGIPPELLNSIFEPFFTTKDADKGTGLGLSTVWSIVEQSQGTIEVESQPGIGTTFQLSWPQGNGVAPSTPRVRRPVAPVNQRTIMVVEDSEAVRQVFVSLLERNGYQVLQAANGTDAVQLEAHFAGTLDLLLTDVVMPGLKGPELARQLRLRRPGLRVILVSGFGTAGDDLGHEEHEFLEKPIEADQLLEKVHAVLTSA